MFGTNWVIRSRSSTGVIGQLGARSEAGPKHRCMDMLTPTILRKLGGESRNGVVGLHSDLRPSYPCMDVTGDAKEEGGKEAGRQSDLSATVDRRQVLNRIMDATVPMSIREIMVTSKDLTDDTGSQLDVVSAEVAALKIQRTVDMSQVTGMHDCERRKQKPPFDLLLGRPWQRGNLVSIDEREEGTYLIFKDRITRRPRYELLAVPYKGSIGDFRSDKTSHYQSFAVMLDESGRRTWGSSEGKPDSGGYGDKMKLDGRRRSRGSSPRLRPLHQYLSREALHRPPIAAVALTSTDPAEIMTNAVTRLWRQVTTGESLVVSPSYAASPAMEYYGVVRFKDGTPVHLFSRIGNRTLMHDPTMNVVHQSSGHETGVSFRLHPLIPALHGSLRRPIPPTRGFAPRCLSFRTGSWSPRTTLGFLLMRHPSARRSFPWKIASRGVRLQSSSPTSVPNPPLQLVTHPPTRPIRRPHQSARQWTMREVGRHVLAGFRAPIRVDSDIVKKLDAEMDTERVRQLGEEIRKLESLPELVRDTDSSTESPGPVELGLCEFCFEESHTSAVDCPQRGVAVEPVVVDAAEQAEDEAREAQAELQRTLDAVLVPILQDLFQLSAQQPATSAGRGTTAAPVSRVAAVPRLPTIRGDVPSFFPNPAYTFTQERSGYLLTTAQNNGSLLTTRIGSNQPLVPTTKPVAWKPCAVAVRAQARLDAQPTAEELLLQRLTTGTRSRKRSSEALVDESGFLQEQGRAYVKRRKEMPIPI
ncbi:hypothetical protein C8F04DRAFT_1186739 [Mycena alexandri]|uniref:Uncharacterized protein n=1 Tax=Mycena alexandri TaxID=1745969 RepID=A0AAD6SMX5_9AGAR|nr:hypothetical protein C8F04DRAFT_1186739 [Mycena alexandri]